MEFVGVKELAQNLRKYVHEKDWVIVTVHGKPKKILKDLSPKEMTLLFQGQSSEINTPGVPLSELKACGMWEKRKEMKNSSRWVNRLRNKQQSRFLR